MIVNFITICSSFEIENQYPMSHSLIQLLFYRLVSGIAVPETPLASKFLIYFPNTDHINHALVGADTEQFADSLGIERGFGDRA